MVRKTEKGAALKRWFQEDWKDVRTGKPCGRQVSEKTPKTSGEMSSSEKRSKIREKAALGQPAGAPRRVSVAKRGSSK
jgi:hypothetical protein